VAASAANRVVRSRSLCSPFSQAAQGPTPLPADYGAAGRLAGPEVLDAVRRFGDQATMPQVVLEAFAESIPVLREKPGQEYGDCGPVKSGPNWGGEQLSIIGAGTPSPAGSRRNEA